VLRIVGTTYKVSRETLEKVAEAAFSVLGIQSAEIELKLVSTAEITRLNRVYRDVDKATDVLSFSLDDMPLMGQVFICYNFTKKQAQAEGKLLEDEISLLLVHGILHIAGYDHAELSEEQTMQKMEKIILERVGIRR